MASRRLHASGDREVGRQELGHAAPRVAHAVGEVEVAVDEDEPGTGFEGLGGGVGDGLW